MITLWHFDAEAGAVHLIRHSDDLSPVRNKRHHQEASLAHPQDSIPRRRTISRQNENPKPLRWTKSADDILASIERFCRRTLDVHAPAG
jgi:hypothetical protein